ncbi:SWIM zinc finger domain-containing protein [[Leptolyngbya] sp. PCC 7376]|uniref:SWIM zinc finger family protein n=1 Tax=[Leptolyngbya] sp. PCC 7376 TaxID=111781 RepID=UPI00029F09D6|nr:SWIM zinc finger family protein [[Leptolyngbya] sp. PCC 7376]AFY39407.1 SWIM zinc finger domain-containing protein [[Leptolyngbya] sp. PCC 7376]
MVDSLPQTQWWVQRWLELLDSYRFKKRLERARIYAKEGNVLSIDFVGSKAIAAVQGSEPEPYKVSLTLSTFSGEDWGFVIESLGQKAIFSAQLLAGEMPAAIEEVFTQNGLNLFPFTLGDVKSKCSCPDKANPCKHIGAVYYQLGDRFSEDPFVIFQLRGRTRPQILDALKDFRLGQNADVEPEKEQKKSTKSASTTVKKAKTKQTLDFEKFWQYDQPLDPSLVVLTPPTDGKTTLEVLGQLNLPQEEALVFQSYLQQVYTAASQQALMQALQGGS